LSKKYSCSIEEILVKKIGFEELRVVEKLLRLNRYVGNSYERRIVVEKLQLKITIR
jgi:hypothetical protein